MEPKKISVLAPKYGSKEITSSQGSLQLEIQADRDVGGAVFLVMIVGNGMLTGRGGSFQAGWSAWLAFIKRPDILGTMLVTSIVTVLVIYWMRDRERR